jgi:hypothetical protein
MFYTIGCEAEGLTSPAGDDLGLGQPELRCTPFVTVGPWVNCQAQAAVTEE